MSNDGVVVDNNNFSVFLLAISLETTEINPALLYSDMHSLADDDAVTWLKTTAATALAK